MADTSLFVAEFTRNSQRVYSYILALVANIDDAEEVYQETSAIAWQKFDAFEPGTNFGAWICRIAYFRAMKLHEKRAGDPLTFDADLLEVIAQTHEMETDLMVVRRKALKICVDTLPEKYRDLLRQRYTGTTVQDIARVSCQTTNAVYKTLYRLHRQLHECISKRLTMGDGP